MPDTLLRTMTLGEKLRGLADIADRDPRDVRWRVECLLDEMRDCDFKADIGAWVSTHLGDRT